MSFHETVEQYQDFDFAGFFDQVTDTDVEQSLAAEKPGTLDFLTLLSPKAAAHLEAMAQKAHQLTVQQFGRTIQMFIPLYLSNHCNNQCAYCGFNHSNEIPRRKLTLDEIENEEEEHLYHSKGWWRELAIASLGMKAVLPPPEERKDVKTAIGASRAEHARKEML